jgi:hypothetical protein
MYRRALLAALLSCNIAPTDCFLQFSSAPIPSGERASAHARFEAYDTGDARCGQRAWSARAMRGVRPG